MKELVIRVDGNSSIGLGHVIRTLALAQMLRELFKITFFIDEQSAAAREILEREGFSVQDAKNFLAYIKKTTTVVLDGYQFDSQFQLQVKSCCAKLVYIDDFARSDCVADVVINHNLGAASTDYTSKVGSKFYLGVDYLLLRGDFFGNSRMEISQEIESIFISLGGADIHNYSQKIIEEIFKFNSDMIVHLLIGSVNPHHELLVRHFKERIFFHKNILAREVTSLLKTCDLAITSASMSSWEACAIGIPLIVGHSADNQISIAKALDRKGLAISIGDFENLKLKLNVILKTLSGYSDRTSMIGAQRNIIDGKSPTRIREIFETL